MYTSIVLGAKMCPHFKESLLESILYKNYVPCINKTQHAALAEIPINHEHTEFFYIVKITHH